MTKEKLIELMDTYLLVVSHGLPAADLHGKEDLADAILQAEHEELQQELWKPTKFEWMNKPSDNIYLGDPGKEDVEWKEHDPIKELLEEFEDYLVNNGFAEVYKDGGVEEFIKSKKDGL